MLGMCLALLEDGQRALFAKIYHKYRDMVYRQALGILKRPELAEEACQDCWLNAALHFDALEALPEGKERPWLLAVARNAALTVKKKEGRYMAEEFVDRESIHALPEAQNAFRGLVELIRDMPENYRGVLELKYVCEWTNRDIAKALRLKEGTVAARLSRGKKLLLERMEAAGYDVSGSLA